MMEPTPIHFVSFYKEVSVNNSVWTIHKDGQVLAVADADGYNVLPFWSSRDRAVNFLNEVEEFEDFTPLEIPWALFKTKWVPDLVEKKMGAGVNWTGGGIECQADPEELVEGVRLQS
jgi:hypothetical protein